MKISDVWNGLLMYDVQHVAFSSKAGLRAFFVSAFCSRMAFLLIDDLAAAAWTSSRWQPALWFSFQQVNMEVKRHLVGVQSRNVFVVSLCVGNELS